MESISLFSCDKVCRVCLSESSNMKSLFTKIGDKENPLLEALTCIVNTKVIIDNQLPEQICGDCEIIILKTEDLKRTYFKSQCILKQYVENNLLTNTSKGKKKTRIKRENAESPNDFIPFMCSKCFTKHTTLASLETHKKKCVGNEKKQETGEKSSNLNIEVSLNNSNIDVKEENYESTYCDSDIDNFQDLPVEYKPLNDIKCSYNSDSDFDELKVFNKNKIFDLEADSEVFLKMLTANSKVMKKKKKIKLSVPDKDKFQCSMCMRKFVKKISLVAHIKKHEEESNVKHVCPTCRREFNYKAHLDNHIINVHTQERGFTCDECSKSFSCQKSLNSHKDMHKIEKKHKCKICEKSFLMLSTLTDHMRTHTGEKPFLCSICGKGFSQKSNLAQHMRRHQGLKLFKCNLCERSFVSKGELEAHSRSHSGLHPFVCTTCSGAFTTSSALVKHRRTHTGERPYRCDLCPATFAATATLTNHRRTHTNERPYQCSHCDKAFVQRTDLVSHIRCHTGEKPYVCRSCGQSFRKAAGLKTHVRNCHGKDQSAGVMQSVNALLMTMPPDIS